MDRMIYSNHSNNSILYMASAQKNKKGQLWEYSKIRSQIKNNPGLLCKRCCINFYYIRSWLLFNLRTFYTKRLSTHLKLRGLYFKIAENPKGCTDIEKWYNIFMRRKISTGKCNYDKQKKFVYTTKNKIFSQN